MTPPEAAGFGAALALASRSVALVLHRRWFRQGFVGDSSVHWAIVRTLRSRPRARWIDEYVISPEPMSYPTGFHRFAALFPLGLVRSSQWLPNLLLWTAGIAGFAAYSDLAARPLLHVPANAVLLSLAFLLLVPTALVFQGPAIAYLKLSERLLGRFATGFVVLLLTVGTLAQDTSSLVGAAVVVAVALVSSIFSRQALVMGLPLLALAWWDWRPLAVLVGGTVLALLLARERFVEGVRHTWLQISRIYPQLTKSSKHVTPVLSSFAGPAELLRLVRTPTELRAALLGREPSRALIMYPELVVLIVLLAASGEGHAWHWGAPVATFGLLYLATSTARLNHLGEAYRYLEFGLFLLAPLEIAILVRTWPTWAKIALLLGLATWSVALLTRLVLRGAWLRELPDRDMLGEFLAGLSLVSGDVVFPVAMRLGADVCARLEGVRSFWWQPGIVAEPIYEEFIEEYPYLKREFRPLFDRYGVTHVVCDKAALERLDWSYDFSALAPAAENEHYVAFVVPRAAASEQVLEEQQA